MTPEPGAVGETTFPNLFEITRHFEASPEQVFDAWVGAEWASWLPFPGAAVAVNAVDTRPGGRYHLSVRLPDGQVVSVVGVYREVSRPTRLVFTWLPSLGGRESLVSVTLEPRHGGTFLTLRHEGLPIPELRARHRQGWLGSLERLHVRLHVHQGRP